MTKLYKVELACRQTEISTQYIMSNIKFRFGHRSSQINKYIEADLDKVETFKLASNKSVIINFKILEKAKMIGFLENNKPVFEQGFVILTVDKFNNLLVEKHSFAVNIGRLPLHDVAKYKYPELVQLEIKCLFEVAQFYVDILTSLTEEQNKFYENMLNSIHKMVERVHLTIMRLSKK